MIGLEEAAAAVAAVAFLGRFTKSADDRGMKLL